MQFAPILIYVCLALIGVGVLLMLGFGVMNLTRGKTSPLSLVVIAVPVVIFLIYYFAAPSDFLATLDSGDGEYVVGPGGYGVMMTALTMLGIGALGLLVTTARGFFK